MKIWINGGNGLVGKSLIEISKKFKDYEIISTTRNDVDLFNFKKVESFVKKYNPDALINCAAKVGGIYSNKKNPFFYIFENNLIQNNLSQIIKESSINNIVNLGSSCVYPKIEDRKIKETDLLKKSLEKSNEFYAIAKINGIKTFEALSIQFDKKVLNLMPTNVYGPYDKFNDINSHVIPALIHKIYLAKKNNKKNIKLWGTGMAKREFIYSMDLAKIILKSIKLKKKYDLINIGTGQELTIKKLSQKIANIIKYEGEIIFNNQIGDGPMRKCLDLNKMKKNISKIKFTSLEEGLSKTIYYYKKNFL